ncbi:hypothetical protein [Streptomyces sp. NPDC007883]|uniref:hypothetical protein n=1 Tax=Streptomyces sp. NPDC007883 TaxID=3155116 RepID=UPI0033EC7894
MALLVLSGVIALAVGGCGCVVWAARGGPRWTRTVSAVTVAAAELVNSAGRRNRSWGLTRGGDSDD